MKKYGIYFLALVCCLNFFAACSDDDDDGPDDDDPVWSDYVATFSTSNVLTLNGTKNENPDVQVVLSKDSNEKAKITLKNILIESASVEFDGIEMVEQANGTYSFSSTQSLTGADTDVTLAGTLTPGAVTKATAPTPVALELTVTRKVVSDLAKSWKLDMTAPFALTPGVSEDAGPAISGIWAGIGQQVNGFVGQALGAKVQAVTINFKENGTFDFSWLPVGETTPKTVADIDNPLIAGIMANMAFEYYTDNGVVYVGDKSLAGLMDLSELQGLIGMYPAIADYMSIIELAMNFFKVEGQYAMLPLNVADIEGGAKAFSLTVPGAILDGDVSNLLIQLLPEQMLGQLMMQLAQAEVDPSDFLGALESLTVQLNFD